MAEGFEENAEFFDLTYEDPETVRLDMAFAAIAPLLWMRAGSQGRRIEEPTDDYDIADTYGVLFSIDAAGPFLKEVAEPRRAALRVHRHGRRAPVPDDRDGAARACRGGAALRELSAHLRDRRG